jgi:hypothetical protein
VANSVQNAVVAAQDVVHLRQKRVQTGPELLAHCAGRRAREVEAHGHETLHRTGVPPFVLESAAPRSRLFHRFVLAFDLRRQELQESPALRRGQIQNVFVRPVQVVAEIERFLLKLLGRGYPGEKKLVRSIETENL